MRYSWLQIILILYILSSLSCIIILTIALNQCNKKCPQDTYCSCHGVQYDGSEGDPNIKTFPGTYCTNKEELKKAYRNGYVWDGI